MSKQLIQLALMQHLFQTIKIKKERKPMKTSNVHFLRLLLCVFFVIDLAGTTIPGEITYENNLVHTVAYFSRFYILVK